MDCPIGQWVYLRDPVSSEDEQNSFGKLEPSTLRSCIAMRLTFRLKHLWRSGSPSRDGSTLSWKKFDFWEEQ